ncbi:MAG: 30S ribosome-binding factor RbfA [Helicobacteraceae bacterium]|nr:30S ribosome-binding factor RbfA [Helicobacteraceae bacterium]
MIDPNVRLQRAQNALYERLREAIASLNDADLASLNVLEAILARGRRDATVLIDSNGILPSDRSRILSKLKKAAGYISGYVATAQGWRHSPALHFKFDDSLENAARLDALFKRIGGETK